MQYPLQLAYLGLEVPDPSALSTFFADVIGLVPGEGAPGRRAGVAQRRQGTARNRRDRPCQ